MRLVCQDRPRELWLEIDCQQHVTSNGNKEALLAADKLAKHEWMLPFVYFSSFAKLANTVNFNQRKIRTKMAAVMSTGNSSDR